MKLLAVASLKDLLGMIEVDAWEPLTHVAERLPGTDLHELMLAIFGAKRGNRITDEDCRTQMRASAEHICTLLSHRVPFRRQARLAPL